MLLLGSARLGLTVDKTNLSIELKAASGGFSLSRLSCVLRGAFNMIVCSL